MGNGLIYPHRLDRKLFVDGRSIGHDVSLGWFKGGSQVVELLCNSPQLPVLHLINRYTRLTSRIGYGVNEVQHNQPALSGCRLCCCNAVTVVRLCSGKY